MTFDFTQLTAQSRYLVDKTFYVELSEDYLGCQSVISVCVVLYLDY